MLDSEYDIFNAVKITEYLSNFKGILFENKKYWVMYLILILMLSLSLFKIYNYQHPKMEIIIIGIVAILGIFFIVDFIKNGKKEAHKTAFRIILIFGLICCLVSPIASISDEGEHLVRAEITSQGVLFPEYVNGSFKTIESMSFFSDAIDQTVFQTNHDTDRINYNAMGYPSAFQQNPFFGYLPQAIGILFAKLLDLNVIWIMWLARFFNAFVYAALVSYAVKKTPFFKIPLIAIACLPICLYQACSASIDCLITSLGILAISYFFDMCTNKFGKRDLLIFFGLCLLTGLCKLPYLGLIFLIFFIPSENFKDSDRQTIFYSYCIIGLFASVCIGFLWSHFYAVPALAHSWRQTYIINNNVNITAQLNFILSHPSDFLLSFFNKIPESINPLFSTLFDFNAHSKGGSYNGSVFVSMLLTLFLGFIFFGYPIEEKLNLKNRIGALFTFIGIYAGTYITMLLTWSPVGELTYSGVNTRYFLPLFWLLPFICNINSNAIKNNDVDKYIMVMAIFFASATIITLGIVNY